MSMLERDIAIASSKQTFHCKQELQNGGSHRRGNFQNFRQKRSKFSQIPQQNWLNGSTLGSDIKKPEKGTEISPFFHNLWPHRFWKHIWFSVCPPPV